ncbi:MAG: hypothetical protein WB502_05815 [Thermoactinomyces sp.]
MAQAFLLNKWLRLKRTAGLGRDLPGGKRFWLVVRAVREKAVMDPGDQFYIFLRRMGN